MNFVLYSKKIQSLIHAFFIFFIVWFLFPNIFTHRDVPRWPVFANRTVEGVDRNQNGLRDDVEIRLHRKINNDQDYLVAINYAAAIERRLKVKAETRTEGLEIFRNESCNKPPYTFYQRNNITDRFLETAIFNTKARIDKSNQNVIHITGGRAGDISEIACGSTIDHSEDLEKYSLHPKNK